MNNKKIWLYLLITLILLFKNYPISYSSPAYYINSRTQKYYYQTNLEQYSNNGKQIISENHQNVYTCPDGFTILDFALTNGNQTQLIGVLFTNQKQTYLEIYNYNTNVTLLTKNMTNYQPWKILFTDVDQDSITEVCLGVYKKSPLHPILTKRLFIYNFHQGLQPKWLGSRLARPFTDFNFIAKENKNILVSLELDNLGQSCLNAYEWDCFGFTGIQTKFNVPIANSDLLKSGYILQNNKYQSVLFLLQQNGSLKIIDLDSEG